MGSEQDLTEAEEVFHDLVSEKYGCPICDQYDGLMGTVSCSNCGYIKPEARA